MICTRFPLDVRSRLDQPHHRRRLQIRRRPPWNVVEHHRQLHRLRHRLKVLKLPLLRRLVIPGIRRQNRRDPRHLRRRPRPSHGLPRSIVRTPRPNRNPPGRRLRHNPDHRQPFRLIERRRLSGRTAGHQPVDPGLHLPASQLVQRPLVDASVRPERCNQRRPTALQLHNKSSLHRTVLLSTAVKGAGMAGQKSH